MVHQAQVQVGQVVAVAVVVVPALQRVLQELVVLVHYMVVVVVVLVPQLLQRQQVQVPEQVLKVLLLLYTPQEADLLVVKAT
jgi:hypothetical protein